jgi:hypothetical protein
VWISTAEFFRFIRASGADFIVTRNPWNLYICDPQYGSLGYDGAATLLEERYLLSLLLEYTAVTPHADTGLLHQIGPGLSQTGRAS